MSDTKEVSSGEPVDKSGRRLGKTGRPIPPKAGIGRKKGVPNKVTQGVKEMVLAALDNVGGADYLQAQAKANPTAFLALVSKLIPRDLKVEGSIDHRLAASEAVERAMAVLFRPPGGGK